jgi:hypothetical protein
MMFQNHSSQQPSGVMAVAPVLKLGVVQLSPAQHVPVRPIRQTAVPKTMHCYICASKWQVGFVSFLMDLKMKLHLPNM